MKWKTFWIRLIGEISNDVIYSGYTKGEHRVNLCSPFLALSHRKLFGRF